MYKRYVKRGDKVFGPYYYESKRKDGRVISSYVAKKENFSKRYLTAFLVLVAIVFIILFLEMIITGRVLDETPGAVQSEEAPVKSSSESPSEPSSESPVSEEIPVDVPPEVPVESPSEEANESTDVFEDNSTIEVPAMNETESDLTELNETLVNDTTANVTGSNLTSVSSNETVIGTNESEVYDFANENASNAEISISTTRHKIVINRPVRWQKKISGELENITVELPKRAESISIRTGDEIYLAEETASEEDVSLSENKIALITGRAVFDVPQSLFRGLWNFILRLIGFRTGKVIDESSFEDSVIETSEKKIVDLSGVDEISGEQEILVEYYTEAPTSREELTENGKRVIVSAPDELGYTDVLAYTELGNEVSMEDNRSIKIYHITELGREEIEFDAYDLDEDGFVDYIEWNVPHLSEQEYEIEFGAMSSVAGCGALDTENEVYTLTADLGGDSYLAETELESYSTCLGVSANNITIDCQGHSITIDDLGFGDSSSIYIEYSVNDTKILNCNILGADGQEHTARHIAATSSNGIYIYNTTIVDEYNPSYGLYTYDSNFTLEDVSINLTNGHPIEEGISMTGFSINLTNVFADGKEIIILRNNESQEFTDFSDYSRVYFFNSTNITLENFEIPKYGIFLLDVYNSSFKNLTQLQTTQYYATAIEAYNGSYNTFEQLNITVNDYQIAISNYWLDWCNFTNNTLISLGEYSYLLANTYGSYNTFSRNFMNLSGGPWSDSFFIQGGVNNTFEYNIVRTSSTGDGFYIATRNSKVYGNDVLNSANGNVVNSGIRLNEYNITAYDNTIVCMGNYTGCLYITYPEVQAFNNTISSFGTIGSLAIETSGASRGDISNNTLTVYNGGNSFVYDWFNAGIYLYQSHNTNLSNNIINCSGAVCYAISSQQSQNNTFYNPIINSEDYNVKMISSSLYLVNASYLGVNQSEKNDGGGTLYKQWWYRAKVTNESGTVIPSVQISAYNVSSSLQFQSTTDSSGYTPLNRITEYTNNGSITSQYSLYNLTAEKSGLDSLSHSYNVSANHSEYEDLFVFSGSSATPTSTPETPGGGGGSGILCEDITWSCGEWRECSDGNQTRTCLSNCGNSRSETRDCSFENETETPEERECTPNFECSEWSKCYYKLDLSSLLDILGIEGIKTRTCEDLNGCESVQIESESCALTREIFVKIGENCERCVEVYDAENRNLVARMFNRDNKTNIDFYSDKEDIESPSGGEISRTELWWWIILFIFLFLILILLRKKEKKHVKNSGKTRKRRLQL